MSLRCGLAVPYHLGVDIERLGYFDDVGCGVFIGIYLHAVSHVAKDTTRSLLGGIQKSIESLAELSEKLKLIGPMVETGLVVGGLSLAPKDLLAKCDFESEVR